jgi:hypothetical protein
VIIRGLNLLFKNKLSVECRLQSKFLQFGPFWVRILHIDPLVEKISKMDPNNGAMVPDAVDT